MTFTEPYIVPALTKHTASVILLHGLGDQGASWAMIASNLRQRNSFNHVSFIFPNAPRRPITLNFGMPMPGWYDLHTIGSDMSLSSQVFTPHLNTEEYNHLVDERGIVESSAYLRSLVDDQVRKGIPPSRVVIGGFSQGGLIAYFTGLTYPQTLGGLFGLSTYLLMTKTMQGLIPRPKEEDNGQRPSQATPVFAAHGTDDDVVPHNVGVGSRTYLKEQMGMSVESHDYSGLPHSACPEELDDLRNWLSRVIPPLPDA